MGHVEDSNPENHSLERVANIDVVTRGSEREMLLAFTDTEFGIGFLHTDSLGQKAVIVSLKRQPERRKGKLQVSLDDLNITGVLPTGVAMALAKLMINEWTGQDPADALEATLYQTDAPPSGKPS